MEKVIINIHTAQKLFDAVKDKTSSKEIQNKICEILNIDSKSLDIKDETTDHFATAKETDKKKKFYFLIKSLHDAGVELDVRSDLLNEEFGFTKQEEIDALNKAVGFIESVKEKVSEVKDRIQEKVADLKDNIEHKLGFKHEDETISESQLQSSFAELVKKYNQVVNKDGSSDDFASLVLHDLAIEKEKAKKVFAALSDFYEGKKINEKEMKESKIIESKAGRIIIDFIIWQKGKKN